MSYMNLVYGPAHHESFVAQWLEHPTRWMDGHRFNCCRGTQILSVMTGKANCFEESGAPDYFYTVEKKNNWKLRHLHVVGDNRGRSSSVGERLTAEREVLGSISGAVLIPNRPLPSSKNPHSQNEARCTTFLVKMSFICMRAPTLVLKRRPGETWK